MLLAKNNLLQNPKGLAYIVNDGLVSFTETNIETDADEYQRQFQQRSGGRGRPSGKSQEAEDWLREYLKDGAKPSGNKNDPEPGTLFGDAVAAGLKCGTVWAAADRIGVKKSKEAFSKRWMWSLPDENEEEIAEGFSEFDAFGGEEF